MSPQWFIKMVHHFSLQQLKTFKNFGEQFFDALDKDKNFLVITGGNTDFFAFHKLTEFFGTI